MIALAKPVLVEEYDGLEVFEESHPARPAPQLVRDETPALPRASRIPELEKTLMELKERMAAFAALAEEAVQQS